MRASMFNDLPDPEKVLQGCVGCFVAVAVGAFAAGALLVWLCK